MSFRRLPLTYWLAAAACRDPQLGVWWAMPASELVYVCVFVPVWIKWACTINPIHGGENLPVPPSVYVTAKANMHTHVKKKQKKNTSNNKTKHADKNTYTFTLLLSFPWPCVCLETTQGRRGKSPDSYFLSDSPRKPSLGRRQWLISGMAIC